MKTNEKIELVVVVLVGAAVALVRNHLPARIDLGDVVLGAAALLLVQGLARDLARLRAARIAAAKNTRTVTCMCAESTIGATAIFAGLIMVFLVTPVVLRPPPIAWPIGVAAVMVFGFLTRNLVLDFRAKRLRWETDHNVNVTWK